MGEHDLHAEARHQADNALRHREGFAVGGGIGPGHRYLFAPEVFHAAHLADDVESVCHGLRRVVDVALEIDESRALLEDAVFKALFDGVDDLVHIGVALADVHIVADADDVGHEGDHVCRLADGLPVRDL